MTWSTQTNRNKNKYDYRLFDAVLVGLGIVAVACILMAFNSREADYADCLAVQSQDTCSYYLH